MKVLNYLLLATVLVSCSTPHWGYKGSESPSHWSELSAEYKKCEVGHKQSPINLSIKSSKARDHEVKFYYHPTPAKIVNNGHTIEFDLEEDNFLMIDENKYKLIQFHFHDPSEHSIEGVHYPAELHLVHKSKLNELAVVGIVLEIGNGKELDHIFDLIPGQFNTAHIDNLHLEKFISSSNSHFYYEGSLTTPPCSENVKWVVLDKHLKVNKDQLTKFKAYYLDNNRPIQPDFSREVFHSSH